MIEPQLNQYEQAMGWRKRQMILQQLQDGVRNDTLEEVAQAFERMEAFGDTAHSFAMFVRQMKNYGTEA
jgi:hypothetical protein